MAAGASRRWTVSRSLWAPQRLCPPLSLSNRKNGSVGSVSWRLGSPGLCLPAPFAILDEGVSAAESRHVPPASVVHGPHCIHVFLMPMCQCTPTQALHFGQHVMLPKTSASLLPPEVAFGCTEYCASVPSVDCVCTWTGALVPQLHNPQCVNRPSLCFSYQGLPVLTSCRLLPTACIAMAHRAEPSCCLITLQHSWP